MASFHRIRHISRREVLAGAAVVGLCAATGVVPAAAEEVTPQFDEAMKAYLGARPLPQDSGVTLTLPELAENGNMVPFSVSIASPMTEEEYVKTITLFSTGNPQPVIGTFTFSPISGRATVSGRLRLARSQDVIAVAELSTGALVLGRANVKVTIGGCGAG